MAANPFISLQVTSRPNHGYYVQWTIDPSFTGKAPYKFKLQAFQDVGFKEPIFEIDVGESFYALDDKNIRQNVLNPYMYRVVLTTADGKEIISPFVGWGNSEGITRHKWLLANEMTRKSWVGLWRFGLYGYLLKRKIYSPTATNEVDPVTGEPIVDSASGSLGVGQLGGYFAPVLTKYWLMAHKEQMDYQQEGHGVTYREDASLWTVGFPFFNSHDVLVDMNGKRFMITKVDDTYFPGTLLCVKQELTTQIIQPTDTVYSIQVPPFPNDNDY